MKRDVRALLEKKEERQCHDQKQEFEGADADRSRGVRRVCAFHHHALRMPAAGRAKVRRCPAAKRMCRQTAVRARTKPLCKAASRLANAMGSSPNWPLKPVRSV